MIGVRGQPLHDKYLTYLRYNGALLVEYGHHAGGILIVHMLPQQDIKLHIFAHVQLGAQQDGPAQPGRPTGKFVDTRTHACMHARTIVHSPEATRTLFDTFKHQLFNFWFQILISNSSQLSIRPPVSAKFAKYACSLDMLTEILSSAPRPSPTGPPPARSSTSPTQKSDISA
eukprot:1157728-Pelagomonas_calceolata.AAC.11